MGISAFSNNDKYRLILNDDPSSKITIAWNQISGTNPQVYYDTVDYGTNYQLYNNVHGVDRSVVFKGMNNHYSRLTGLQPNTAYYFVIHDSEGVSQRFWFKTAPADNSRLSLIAGGDSRNNRIPRQKANLMVSKLKPNAIFFGGDMTDADTDAEWKAWFDDWQLTTATDGRMFPIVATRGNHEGSFSIYNLFDSPNQESYYALTFGDNLIRGYVLNTEISVLGDQLTWLQDDLAENTTPIWKMAIYHRPMRPHTSNKPEWNFVYDAWAQLFYDENMNLVVDSDSHMSKTTWPVKPSSGPNSDEGFEIDYENGTVYTGEGCWGAPLRPNDDDKSWTRNSGVFNQFKLIFVDVNEIEMRTIKVDNADDVGENPNDDPFQIPANLDVFSPESGAVVTISSNSGNNPCPPSGTLCDDGDVSTLFDIEDGDCNCVGIAEIGTTEIQILSSDNDAEEGESGSILLSSSNLELVYDTSADQFNQIVGLRFTDVNLPQNAVITNAYLQFTVDEDDSDQAPTNLLIEGENVANSIVFEELPNNISSRTRTTSQINWDNVPLWETIGEADLDQRTPDISSIIEEILSRPDWSQNNALSIIISGSGKRVAEAFDGESSSAPILVIEYDLTTLSVQDQNLNAEELKVYPNPTDSYINLELNNATISKVSIFDITGRLIETTIHDANNVELDTNSLTSGNYFLKVKTSKGSIFKRFIKQ